MSMVFLAEPIISSQTSFAKGRFGCAKSVSVGTDCTIAVAIASGLQNPSKIAKTNVFSIRSMHTHGPPRCLVEMKIEIRSFEKKYSQTAEGILFSERFQDTYFSRSGAIAESQHVFLGGCGVAEGLRSTQAGSYCVAELGF